MVGVPKTIDNDITLVERNGTSAGCFIVLSLCFSFNEF